MSLLGGLLNPFGGGGGSSTGISADKSNTTTNNTSSTYIDSRQVTDAGGGLVGTGNSWDQSFTDSRDMSTLLDLKVNDSSNRSTDNSISNSWSDSRNMSTALDLMVNDSSNRSTDNSISSNWSDSRNMSTSLDLMVNDNSNRSTDNSISSSWSDSRSLSDSRNMSTSMDLRVNDSSNRSSSTSTSWADNSNRSINMTDPGALRALETSLTTSKQVTDRAFSFGTDAFGFARQTASDSAAAAAEAQSEAYSFASKSNATLSAGFSELLSAGMAMFDSNVKTVQEFGTLTADAYRSATSEKSGSLDNKTIMVLGLAAAGALALMAWKK